MPTLEELVAAATRQIVAGLVDQNGAARYTASSESGQISDIQRAFNDGGAFQPEAPKMCKIYVLKDRNRFRVRVVDTESDRKVSYIFATKEEADAAVPKLYREYRRPVGMELSKALDEYKKYLVQKGNRERSIEVTMQRLEGLLESIKTQITGDLTPGHLDKAWKEFTEKVSKYTKSTPSIDTQANTLNQTKTFFRWCNGKNWLKGDPIDHLQVIGRRRKGKPQFVGLDESRKFLDTALELGAKGDVGAVVAATLLLMGMRASEVADRLVRELDDGGKIFVITSAKTEAGVRRLRIPVVLQPLLQGLAKGKERSERLFGDIDRHWVRNAVIRVCGLAKVPVLSSHGLRGTHASLAVEAGMSGDAVASSLGHDSFQVTKDHYAKSESVSGARSDRVAEALRN